MFLYTKVRDCKSCWINNKLNKMIYFNKSLRNSCRTQGMRYPIYNLDLLYPWMDKSMHLFMSSCVTFITSKHGRFTASKVRDA